MLQSGAQRGAGREGLPGAGKGETADVGNGSLAVDGVETVKKMTDDWGLQWGVIT